MVANGEFSGQTLDKVLEAHPEFLGDRVDAKEGLPILVKLIDAERDLSVQVHPDDDYALKHENQKGKTEMWYVLDAKPGATLVHGFAHNVTEHQLKNAIKTGTLSKHLQKVKVNKGDLFYIPAGTVHAIGAGILIAEIQENSNVTYRVYDYDRVDKDGNKRELHIDKAVSVMDMKSGAEVRQQPRIIKYYPGCSREMLCRCKYFEVERIQVSKGFSFSVTDSSFQVLLCLDGNGGIETAENNKPLRFSKGDCLFLPSGIGRCYVLGDTTLLKIRC
jgi:mannose-6-phosphate isomerase